jgi:hypothetical protein
MDKLPHENHVAATRLDRFSGLRRALTSVVEEFQM